MSSRVSMNYLVFENIRGHSRPEYILIIFSILQWPNVLLQVNSMHFMGTKKISTLKKTENKLLNYQALLPNIQAIDFLSESCIRRGHGRAHPQWPGLMPILTLKILISYSSKLVWKENPKKSGLKTPSQTFSMLKIKKNKTLPKRLTIAVIMRHRNWKLYWTIKLMNRSRYFCRKSRYALVNSSKENFSFDPE